MGASKTERSWVLEDRAITDPSEDAFDHQDIAKQLAEAIKSLEHATTIGLIGGFGTGKSSIGNLLEVELSGHRKLQVVRFSAEKHSGIARQRAMVYSLAHALQENGHATEGQVRDTLAQLAGAEDKVQVSWSDIPFLQLMRDRQHRERILKGAAWSAATALTLYLFLTLGARIFGASDPWRWPFGPARWLFGAAFLPVLGITATTWTKAALNVPTITRRRPRAEAADEIERVFADLVLLAKKRLVIIVDDIDRLAPAEVLEAIKAVKTFQQVPKDRPPFFVIACDDKVVEEAIVDATPGIAQVGNDDWRAAAEFLNKFFVVRQVLPPHMPGDMPDYALRIVQQRDHPAVGALGPRRLDDVIGLLIHEDVSDPRHVLRLLNAFFADYRLAQYREKKSGGRLQQGEVTENPHLLARLTVLKVDFRDVYEAIAADFDLLTAIDRRVTGRELTDAQRQIFDEFQSHGRRDDAKGGSPGVPDDQGEGADDLDSFRVQETDGRPIATIVNSRERAIEYLRATAGYVQMPPTLTAFIFLGLPATDREIGSKAAEAVRRALRLRNVDGLRKLFQTADQETAASLVAVVDRLIRDSRREPQRSNAIHTAASVLDLLAEPESNRLADQIAVVLGMASSSAPRPRLLLSTIERSTSDHRAGLVTLLTRFPDGEEHELRDERAHAVLGYGASNPGDRGAEIALRGYFEHLAEEGSWGEALQWVRDACAVEVSIRVRLLGSSFYAAIIELASGADEVTDDDIAQFRRLVADANSDDMTTEVRKATIRCLQASGAAPRSIAAEVLSERDYANGDAAEIALALAQTLTSGPLADDPGQLALGMSLLTAWAPDYANETYLVASDDADNDDVRPMATAVTQALLRGLRADDQETVQKAGQAARRLLTEAPDRVQPLVEGCILISSEFPEPDSLNGNEARTVLVDALDVVLDDLASQAAKHLTEPLVQGADPEAPEVIAALDRLPGLLKTEYGKKSSETLTSGWRQQLTVATSPGQEAQVAMRAIDLAFIHRPGNLGNEVPAIRSRLSTMAASGQPQLVEFARTWLIKLSWPSQHADVATDYAAMVDALSAKETDQMLGSLAHWPASSRDELPEGLLTALAVHVATSDASEGSWEAIGAIWSGFDMASKVLLVDAGAGTHHVVDDYLDSAKSGEIELLLNHLSGQEGFVSAVRVLAGNTENASAAAEPYLVQATSGDRAWHPEEIDAVVRHLLAKSDIAKLVEHSRQTLADGQGQADRALDLLISLLRHHREAVEGSSLIEPLGQLLPEVGSGVGAKVGTVVGLAHLNHKATHLSSAQKALRSRDGDGHEVPEAYNTARELADRE